MCQKNRLCSFLMVAVSLYMVFALFSSCGAYSKNGNRGGTTIIWDTDQILLEDHVVDENETLIINPGVIVYLEENVSLIIKGSMYAVGEENNEIIFKNKSSPQEVEDGIYREREWAGIYIYSSNVTIDHCIIKGGNYGAYINNSSPTIRNSSINGDYAIYSINSSPVITNSRIDSSSFSGIYCSGGAPIITNNSIGVSSPPHIVGIHSVNSSSPLITNNIIQNVTVGIWITHLSTPTLINNTIINNYIGIYSIDSSPVIKNNVVGNNKEWGIRIGSCENLTIENNTFEDESGNPNGLGRIVREWLLTVNVVDKNGKPIEGGFVSVRDCFGNVEWNETTKVPKGGNKPVADDCVTQYVIDNNGTEITYTPHTIYVEKNGVSNSTTIVMDDDKEITIMLNLTLEEDNNYLKPIYIVPIIGTIGVIGACVILIKRKQHKKE